MSYDITLNDPVSGAVIEFDKPHQLKGGTYQVGGSRDAWLNITYNYSQYYYDASECGTRTEIQWTEAEAVTAWNKAMGGYKSEFAITKGYWMATYDGLHCSVCNYKCESTALPNVCPHCGTRMKTANEWSL